jgi:hypothetical protein
VEDLIQRHEAERSTAATAEIEELNRTQLLLKLRSNAAAAEIEELDQEAGRLAQKLMEHVTEKRKRDFEVRLLKEELSKRKINPRGVPQGPSPEALKEERERDAEKKRKDAEWRLKCKKDYENSPMQLYLKDVQANIARDPDFYRRKPAPAHMRREFLSNSDKELLDAARAVWPKRYGRELPETMTHEECDKALKVGHDVKRK